MLPIDPTELSAFLDGELPARRAEEVRAALAQDPVLRQSYELLVERDGDWNAQAAAAMFRPRVRIPHAPVAGRFVTNSVPAGGMVWTFALMPE